VTIYGPAHPFPSAETQEEASEIIQGDGDDDLSEELACCVTTVGDPLLSPCFVYYNYTSFPRDDSNLGKFCGLATPVNKLFTEILLI